MSLLIRGGTVVTAEGSARADVYCADGVIKAVGPNLDAPSGARVVDAGGQFVMPGGIDPHVHCKWYMPHPDGTVTHTDPPSIVSRAALHGGTTTLIDFARWTHGKTIQRAIEDRHADWRGQCYCDYSFHVMVEGALPPDIFDQLAEALRSGYPTVKIFTTDITPSRRGRMVDFGDIWEVFKVVTAFTIAHTITLALAALAVIAGYLPGQLAPEEVAELIRKRTIGPLTGFRSRMGKPFSAALKLNDELRPEFDFGQGSAQADEAGDAA